MTNERKRIMPQPTVESWAKALKYHVKLETVGNPDFQQFAPISEVVEFQSAQLESIVGMAKAYRHYWNAGGGNWVDPEVTDVHEQKVIGRISYNGRLIEGYTLTCKDHRCDFTGRYADFSTAFDAQIEHEHVHDDAAGAHGETCEFNTIEVEMDRDVVAAHQTRHFEAMLKEDV
jgi:hypothetical protein